MSAESVTRAINLKAADYRDYDKLVRLLTCEGEIISAVMRGVKKQDAKLKFAAQPLCFCEYTLASGRGYPVVTGASVIEGFYSLSSDYEAFTAAAAMAEAAEIAALGEQGNFVFLELIKCLRALCYEGAMPELTCAYYIMRLLDNGGYRNEYPSGSAGSLAGVCRTLSKIEANELAGVKADKELALRALKNQAKRFCLKMGELKIYKMLL